MLNLLDFRSFMTGIVLIEGVWVDLKGDVLGEVLGGNRVGVEVI